MKKLGSMLTALAVALLLAMPLAAAAKKDKDEKEHGKGKSHKEHVEDREKEHEVEREVKGALGVFFSTQHRDAIHDYYNRAYVNRGSCPPGLAKKHNGCLPPGQAKKRYQINHALPSSVVPLPIPWDLQRRLGPPPAGHEYGYVDGEVLLYQSVGKIVVDSIGSLF